MNCEILYDASFSLAVVSLEQSEQIMAESGAMVSMSPTIKMEARMSGGGALGAIKAPWVASRCSVPRTRPSRGRAK